MIQIRSNVQKDYYSRPVRGKNRVLMGSCQTTIRIRVQVVHLHRFYSTGIYNTRACMRQSDESVS